MPDRIDTHRFNFFPSLEALPQDSHRLWHCGSVQSFFLSRGWFDCLIEAGLDKGDRIALGALRSADGQVLALVPVRITNEGARIMGRQRLRSLTGIYACLYRPILVPDAVASATARSLGRHLGAALTSSDTIQLDAMDADWSELRAFEAGLKEAGFATARYDHFGNWWEAVAGRSFEQYLSAREGSIREIVRRRRRGLEKLGTRFDVVSQIDGIDKAIADYETVYARSWKEPEPHPRLHAHLMRSAARDGVLRLGFCQLGDRPIAVQLWIMWHGRATVLKLAHDQEFDRLSPGSVLLAHMVRHVIERDAATEIDFGRGDDSYKRHWVSQRRQRIGILAASPRSLVGLGVLTRQLAGGWFSSLRGRSRSHLRS